MEELEEIVRAFSKKEQKEFRRFIQHSRHKLSRKDLTLFDHLIHEQNDSGAGFYEKAYAANSNRNAYHSLRKRLVKQLHDFIHFKSSEYDESLKGSISKDLALVGRLFDLQLPAIAWKHLKKLERKAQEHDMYQQLVPVYDLQIIHYSKDFQEEALDKLVSRRLKAEKLAIEEERLRITGSLVRQELERVRIEASEIDLDKLVARLLKRFELDDAIFNRPRLLYDFVVLTRNVVLANKAFFSFEPFLMNSFRRIEKSAFFQTHNGEHLNMLYMVCHTLYRNRKFEEAKVYLHQMEIKLREVNVGLRNHYEPRYGMLWAACTNFSGDLQGSIQILENLLRQGVKSMQDQLNMRLNLAVYYFQAADYKTANKTLVQLGHTDRWCEKVMGIEWRLKKNIIELFFQYELGNTDIAFDRILTLERNFKNLLKTKKYERVGVFLRLIKYLIDNPGMIHSVEFKERVENSFEWRDIEEEDIQAMSYYAWLKAKMNKRSFYEVLLDLLNQRPST